MELLEEAQRKVTNVLIRSSLSKVETEIPSVFVDTSAETPEYWFPYLQAKLKSTFRLLDFW